MNKHLKLFANHTAYEAAKNNIDKPNVVMCQQEDEVHFNIKPNVTSTSSATKIINAYTMANVVSEIEIDGIVQPNVISSYTFNTTGEHIVKYTLVNDTTIGDNAFKQCVQMTEVTIPNSVTTIGNNAFSRCSGLTLIDIPNSVTSIGEEAFSRCTGLTSVTIGNSVRSIGGYAFSTCTGLTSIFIPNSVNNVGQAIFGGCNNLISIIVDNSNGKYDSRNNCNAIIETSTNKLVIGCSNSIIPNSVTSIGHWAFNNFTELTSIIIPSSITSIGKGAFSDCASLTSITCNATTAPTIDSQTFQNVKTTGKLYVPSGSTGYEVWMGTGNYYLGKYNWTKVEF